MVSDLLQECQHLRKHIKSLELKLSLAVPASSSSGGPKKSTKLADTSQSKRDDGSYTDQSQDSCNQDGLADLSASILVNNVPSNPADTRARPHGDPLSSTKTAGTGTINAHQRAKDVELERLRQEVLVVSSQLEESQREKEMQKREIARIRRLLITSTSPELFYDRVMTPTQLESKRLAAIGETAHRATWSNINNTLNSPFDDSLASSSLIALNRSPELKSTLPGKVKLGTVAINSGRSRNQAMDEVSSAEKKVLSAAPKKGLRKSSTLSQTTSTDRLRSVTDAGNSLTELDSSAEDILSSSQAFDAAFGTMMPLVDGEPYTSTKWDNTAEAEADTENEEAVMGQADKNLDDGSLGITNHSPRRPLIIPLSGPRPDSAMNDSVMS